LGGRARAPLVRRQELRPLARTHGSGCTAWSGDGNVEALRALLVAKRSARSIRIKTTGQLRHLVITAPDDVRAQLGGLTTKALINKAAALRPSAGTDARHVRRWTRRSLSRTAQPAPTCSTGRRGDEDGGRVVTALKCLRGVCKRANDIRRATHELAARLDANQHVYDLGRSKAVWRIVRVPREPQRCNESCLANHSQRSLLRLSARRKTPTALRCLDQQPR
jgi:hypothetical protein